MPHLVARIPLDEPLLSCLIMQFQRSHTHGRPQKCPGDDAKAFVADIATKRYTHSNSDTMWRCAIDFPLAPLNTKKLLIIYRGLNNLCALAAFGSARSLFMLTKHERRRVTQPSHLPKIPSRNDRKDRNML
jgi:hypothetical protein